MPAFLQYDFMIRALIGGVLVGGLAPVLGAFLVLRRFSLLADSLSHVALLGVAVGLAINIAPQGVTFAIVAAGALAIETLRAKGKLPGDVALAVILYASLAGAVCVISIVSGFNVDLLSYLFGSILTVTSADLWMLGALAAFVFAAVTVFFVELAQASFDEDLAAVSGVPVRWVNLGVALLAAAAITLAMRVMGALLVGALIVMPAFAAQSLASSLRGTVVAAAALGMGSAVVGLIVAFYADLPGGGAIVLVAFAVLLAAAGWRQARPRSG